jgi:hypothetical protein
MNKTIKLSVFYSLMLLILFIPSQLYGEVYGVTCFDGSHHPPGFDCRDLLQGGSTSGSGANSNDERTYDRQQQDRYQQEIERQHRLRRQLQEAEEEASRREEEAKEKFLREKNEALNSIKGVSSGILQIKGSNINKTLDYRGAPDISLKTSGRDSRRIPTAWKQLHCGSSISGYAMEKANPKNGEGIDIDEVRYLTGQADKALSGAKLGVECPQTPVPPEPYGKVKVGSDSDLVKFYRKLLIETERGASKVWQAEREIWKSRLKKRTAVNGLQKAELEVARLEKKITELEEPLPTATPTQDKLDKKEAKKPHDQKRATKAREIFENKKRALAKAMAALKKAKQAMSNLDKTIESAEKQKNEAQAKLGQHEEMFNRVKAEPALAQSYIGKMGD